MTMIKKTAIKNLQDARIPGDIYTTKTSVNFAVSFGGSSGAAGAGGKYVADLRRFCKPMPFKECLNCASRVDCFINGKKCLIEGG
jgi:hypothetical protein